MDGVKEGSRDGWTKGLKISEWLYRNYTQSMYICSYVKNNMIGWRDWMDR